MSLRAELGAERPPAGYTLLTPPDWGRFPATTEGRDELIRLMSSRFKAVGRPDLDAETRSMVHRQWQRMQSANVMEIFLPVEPAREGATPMSVAASPWVAAGDFESDLRGRAGAERPVERVELPEPGTVFRWVAERPGPEGMAELFAREISYVVPFPGRAPRRGVLLMASIVHLGVEESGQALEAFTTLADAMVSTFRWRFA
ncbi:hypothetical protein BKA24_000252 [Microbacterium marinum]|uniref:Uncharacterized protein n=1 Tax=Microbacterium marinum TaxID=421115 RepID=A0A7W7FHY5_9MICO|nr:hypothetical protein [Microbacterium marinum]MBB4665543.1 hypothetical protein [Microbacterium marinum]